MGTPTVTHVETAGDTTSATSYTSTASLAPSEGDLCLVFAVGRDPTLAPVDSIVNNGTLDLTWTHVTITGTTNIDFTTNDVQLDLFAAIAGGTPGSGTVTIDYGAAEDTLNSAAWSIVVVTPSQGAWASVAAALLQAVAASDITLNSSPLAVTLGALNSADSLNLGFMCTYTAAGTEATIPTVGDGFSSVGSGSTTGPGVAIRTQEDIGVTSITATYSNANAAWACVGLEIADPGVAAGSTPIVYFAQMRARRNNG